MLTQIYILNSFACWRRKKYFPLTWFLQFYRINAWFYLQRKTQPPVFMINSHDPPAGICNNFLTWSDGLDNWDITITLLLSDKHRYGARQQAQLWGWNYFNHNLTWSLGWNRMNGTKPWAGLCLNQNEGWNYFNQNSLRCLGWNFFES